MSAQHDGKEPEMFSAGKFNFSKCSVCENVVHQEFIFTRILFVCFTSCINTTGHLISLYLYDVLKLLKIDQFFSNRSKIDHNLCVSLFTTTNGKNI